MKRLINIFLLVFLAFLFFYKLDFTALESFDEAWYADISRNLVVNKNPFHLVFNKELFTDHPPLGFILMSVSHMFMRNGELAARLVPALLGFLSVIVIFLIGKKMKDEFVGYGSGAVLVSSMWFMLRARSGNLDIIFLFWLVLTFYLLLLLKENKKYFYLTVFSFSSLIMTKTLAGLGVLPVLLYAFWINRKKLNTREIIYLLSFGFLLIAPWYLYNHFSDPSFLRHHFIDIAGRGGENTLSLSTISRSLFYLQVGMGKWYKMFFASVLLSIFLWKKSIKYKENIKLILLTFLGFGLPLLFSSKVEIWHLIPLFPFVALVISFSLIKSASLYKKRFKYLPHSLLILILMISVYQFYQFSNLIYLKEKRFSSERDISEKASAYSQVYLMSDFYPAAVYYSETKIVPLRLANDAYQQMISLLEDENVFIIDQSLKNDLERDEINFSIIGENVDYYLITQ